LFLKSVEGAGTFERTKKKEEKCFSNFAFRLFESFAVDLKFAFKSCVGGELQDCNTEKLSSGGAGKPSPSSTLE
jgi:hypothetical protein